MTHKIEMGYDPLTNQQLDAEYHYEDDSLFMIKSSTGIELLPEGLPDMMTRWSYRITEDDLKQLEPLKGLIFNILNKRLVDQGVSGDKAFDLLWDSDCSIILKGKDTKVIWEQ